MKRLKSSYIPLAGLFLCGLLSCRSSDGTLNPEQMKKVLWELSRVEAYTNNYLHLNSTGQKDSLARLKYAQVFAYNKIKPEQFFRTLALYRENPAAFRVLLDSVNAYGSRSRENFYSNRYGPENPPPNKVKQPQQQ